MATRHVRLVPMGGDSGRGDAAVQRNWSSPLQMSSAAAKMERFLALAGHDRGPWLVVAFGLGIIGWFALNSAWAWSAAIGGGLLVAIAGGAMWRVDGQHTHLRGALIALGLLFAAGIATIWIRSEVVGATAIERPTVEIVQGYILEREDQPARDRVRLVLAIRDAEEGMARKIRVNVPIDQIGDEVAEGAVLRIRARLMPPASPMLPGGYDFARTAWFKGLAATGSVIGEIEVVRPAAEQTKISGIQRWLAAHVRSNLDGSAGSIASAFATGDRGAISKADEIAMRDAGLTHLLSISGLHVSAVIAAAYLIALKTLSLWPTFALKFRLPVVAAAIAALAGIGYTLLTGSQVPTVRSCIAAMLVLGAVALGRDALSLRMVAVAAFCVLLLWPEAIVGPSFQMSFAAVIAIVALHNCAPVRAFLAPREEGRFAWVLRRGIMLLVTGLVIEIALMPIVLFHFHRSGLYGALANVIAIPLVTFVSMPFIAIALALDLLGLGKPAWWVVQQSLDLLLWIAHTTASQPGAVKLMPQMSDATIALFVGAGLWLSLWRGGYRLLGFLPAACATAMLITTPVPDVLISSDGRHVGITTADGQLVSLRESRSDYARENLLELAGVEGYPIFIEDWQDARCSPEFCTLSIFRGGRNWTLLLARNRVRIEERALSAACERADIVVADRWLPISCRPKWLKADRKYLRRSGGLALNLKAGEIAKVSDGQGEHGWWRGEP